MLTFCLAVLLATPTLELTSAPSGATVLWTRPESPVARPAGTTPCTVALTGPPRLGDYSLILRKPGYLDAVFHLSSTELSGTMSRHVELQAFRPERLEELTGLRFVPPPAPPGCEADDLATEAVRAADGLGWYYSRALRDEDDQRVADELWWLPDEGAPRRMADWRAGGVPGLLVYSEIHGSPDGLWVALSRMIGDGSLIEILSRDGLRRQVVAKRQDRVFDYLRFSPGGRYLWYTNGDPRLDDDDWPPTGETAFLSRTHEVYDLLQQRVIPVAEAGEALAFTPEDRPVRVRANSLQELNGAGEVVRAVPLSRPVTELRFASDGRLAGVVPAPGLGHREQLQGSDWLAEIDRRSGEVRPVAALWPFEKDWPRWGWLPDGSGWLVHTGWSLYRLDATGRVIDRIGSGGGFLQLDWRPDSGSLLGVAETVGGSREAMTVGFDGSRQPLRPPVAGAIWEARCGPAGDLLLLGDEGALVGEGAASLWQLGSTEPMRLASGLTGARSLSAAGGTIAMVLGYDDGARLWVRRGPDEAEIPAGAALEVVEVGPDGLSVALGDRAGRAGIWRWGDGAVTWFEPPREVVAPRWLDDERFLPHPDAPRAITGEGSLTQIVPATAAILQPWAELGIHPHDESPQIGAQPSPDGRWLAAIHHGVPFLASAERRDRPRSLLEPEIPYRPEILAQPAEMR